MSSSHIHGGHGIKSRLAHRWLWLKGGGLSFQLLIKALKEEFETDAGGGVNYST